MVFDILSAILLYSFAIPVVMYYRIWPIEGTPYWLFGVLFVLLSVNVCISLQKNRELLKNSILAIVLVIVLGGTVYTAMVDRSRVAPVWGVHDIILQEEAAIRYLTRGRNPYKETYFGTPVESFDYKEPNDPDAVNPALYHFVMPPWYLVFHVPFYYVSVHTLGYFDARLPLLFLMGVLLVALWFWIKDKSLARLAIILTALSPSVVNYFVEGRSDVFALSWLVLTLLFLQKKNWLLSGAFLALAAMSKQTIWFVIPFFFLIFFHNKNIFSTRSISFWSVFILVIVVCMLPFLFWDARAFVDSVVFYLSGNAPHSYPIAGYGLGMVLYEFGIIHNIHAYYPFIFWQILFALPLFLYLATWVLDKPNQSRILISYAVFLTVVWYMSRYFNNSHLGFIAMIFVLGAIKYIDEHTIEVKILPNE